MSPYPTPTLPKVSASVSVRTCDPFPSAVLGTAGWGGASVMGSAAALPHCKGAAVIAPAGGHDHDTIGPMTYFTRMELAAALHELGQLAVDAGKVIDLAL